MSQKWEDESRYILYVSPEESPKWLHVMTLQGRMVSYRIRNLEITSHQTEDPPGSFVGHQDWVRLHLLDTNGKFRGFVQILREAPPHLDDGIIEVEIRWWKVIFSAPVGYR